MIYSLSNLDSISDNVIVENNGKVVTVSYNNEYLLCDFLYFTFFKNEIYFSKNFFEIARFVLDESSKIEFDENVINFFNLKGYAPLDSTIFNNILKLPNLCSLNICLNSLEYYYTIDEISNSNSSRFDEEIIVTSIQKSFKENVDNIILFSGGLDSTLLLLLSMKYLNKKNIKLVTGRITGLDFEPNKIDIETSKKISQIFDLPLEVIDLNINNVKYVDIEEIIIKQPNNAHFSVVFQEISRHIQTFDNSVISGQQADSILNFGSTSFFKISRRGVQGLGELFRRFIYLYNKKTGKLLFNLLNRNLIIGEKVSQLSIILGYKKLPYIKDRDVFKKSHSALMLFLDKFNNSDRLKILNSNHLFYVFYHLAGSDASGILSNFRNCNDIMPFNNKTLVKYYINKRYKISEVFIPKKVVVDLVKRDLKVYKILMNKPNTPNLSYEILFDHVANNLDLKNEFNNLCEKYKIYNLSFSFNNYHLIKCLNFVYEFSS